MPIPRALIAADRERVTAFLDRRWGGATIMLDQRAIDASALPGYLAEHEGAVVGLITLLDDARQSEIVTLDAVTAQSGLGTRLLDCAAQRARALGLRRLLVRTSNDNLDALRFYQRRGFRLHHLAAGAIDRERELKPDIPLIGRYGIALRDEIGLVRALDAD
jgi:N-acetylglutamate synthase-like GNAT family acetyltransferase